MSAVALTDIQNPEGAAVPRAWTAAMTHLHGAQVARDSIRAATTQQMRDDATVRFGHEMEKLFEQMLELRTSGATGVITMILSKRERR